MRVLKTIVVLMCMGLFSVALAWTAKADQWDNKTTLTFSEPVEVPGLVLQPGTYVFKLFDSSSNRNIVQIFNKDMTHLYATILAISDYRLQSTDKTVITFGEGAEKAEVTPDAIHEWFYPGKQWGQEFVYPRQRAVELAKAYRQPVLAMPSETATVITKPVTSVNEPEVQALKQAPVVAITPENKEMELAQVRPTEPPDSLRPMSTETASSRAMLTDETHHELPKTASSLPLLALLGLGTVGAGLTLRTISRRMI